MMRHPSEYWQFHQPAQGEISQGNVSVLALIKAGCLVNVLHLDHPIFGQG
ncbi:conserved hypothetical protein [Ricinus communis]|uniref:Uncharacterized protein n=1 Tax=Ricinus communis TaxID=3988 RepID=B9S6Z9_RICCO|nr:conserved hypothetical protein [Ricinus communis]